MALDGNAPWRTSPEKLTADELKFIAERLAIDDVEAAEQLRRLGYDASPVVDSVLASGGWFSGGSWMSPGDRVRARQVLRAAEALNLDAAEVAARYSELGYDVRDAVGSLGLMGLDADDGRQLWAAAPGRLRGEWVAQAAARLHMSVTEATRRLRGEELVVLDATPEPYLDEAIIGEIGQRRRSEPVRLATQSRPVARSDVIELAARGGRRTTRVTADLRALGFTVPPVQDPGAVDDELRKICSIYSSQSGIPLRFDNGPMPVGPVIKVARQLVLPIEYVAERMRSVGYQICDTTGLTEAEKRLCGQDLENLSPWAHDADLVSVWQLTAAAFWLDKSPHLVARRLRELGYDVPQGWG